MLRTYSEHETVYSCSVVTLPAKVKQKLSKLLSKGFERSVHWNVYERKSENKNTTNMYEYFLDSNFVGANRLFVLIYSHPDGTAKSYKAGRYYLPKVLAMIMTSLSMEKTFMTSSLI